MSVDKIKLLNLLLGEMFNAVTADEVLETKYAEVGGKVKVLSISVGGQELTESDIKELQSEARTIKDFLLWKLLNKRIRYIAQRKSCERSVGEEDIIFPKAILFALEEMEKVLNILEACEIPDKKKK